MLFYLKGNNSKMGDNSDMKKNMGHLFFHEEYIYKFQTLSSMVLKLCYAPESGRRNE